jgi:hypothetical protein
MSRASLRVVLLAFGLVVGVMIRTGWAQTRWGCQTPVHPSVGGAVGRSSPYLDFRSGVVTDDRSESVSVGTGWTATGRADVSLAGPIRLRLDASGAWWNVTRRAYNPVPPHQIISDVSAGHVSARSVGVSLGLRGGRPPACGHVLVGGGLYSLRYRGMGTLVPGVAITAGIEMPIGTRGAVQADVQLHLIHTPHNALIASSAIPAASLTFGWAHRFR